MSDKCLKEIMVTLYLCSKEVHFLLVYFYLATIYINIYINKKHIRPLGQKDNTVSRDSTEP